MKLYLREWRLKKWFTLNHVAERLNTTKGVVCRWETGDRKVSDEVKEWLAHVYGLPSMLWLFIDPEAAEVDDDLSLDILLAGQPPEVKRKALALVQVLCMRDGPLTGPAPGC